MTTAPCPDCRSPVIVATETAGDRVVVLHPVPRPRYVAEDRSVTRVLEVDLTFVKHRCEGVNSGG